MNSNNIEKVKTTSEKYNHKKYSTPMQKRKRENDNESLKNKENNKVNVMAAEPEMKKRQPQSLFRPWSDIKETKVTEKPAPSSASTSTQKEMAPSVSYQTKVPLPANPVLISPYHMAMQQQQHQTALAMQQAMYQQQMLVAHLWARQRNFQHHQQQQQQQQMMLHHHHQQQQQQHQMRQQQMFAFSQQQQGQ